MSIKIKIDDDKISINDVFISENNPRFTLLNDLDDNLKEFISSKSDGYSQKNIFEKLLSFEGDFSDLYRLLEKIYTYGFENSNEPIYLIKKRSNEFFVAEGNRRVMVLKILINIFEFPKNLDKIKCLNNFNNYYNENTDDLLKNEEFYEDDDKKEKNFNLCREMIEKIKNYYDGKEWIVHIKVIDDSQDIWKSIYDKHLTGERPGMRKWSRSKYFADLLNLFPDGINKNSPEISGKIFKNLFREIDKIIQDFKEAQFIYACIFFGESLNDTNKIDHFNNKDILSEMISLNRVSALERGHSFSKIKAIICDDILKIKDKKKFDDEYIKISFNSNNRIQFSCKKIKLDVFLKFIYDNWKKGIITTRPIKKDKKNEFINEIKITLLNYYDLNNRLSISELDEIDESSLSISQLEDLLMSNKTYHNKTDSFKKFQSALEIRKKNNLLKETLFTKLEMTNAKSKEVFKKLYEQLCWNSQDDNYFYFNAVACTIRSLIEQFVMWFYYFSIDKREDKEEWIRDAFCSKKVSYKIANILNNEKKKRIFSDNKINKSIEYVSETKETINECVNKFNYLIHFDNRKKLNSYIHSSHKIYESKSKSVLDDAKGFLKKNIDNLEYIIKNTDFSKLNDLDDEISKTMKITNS